MKMKRGHKVKKAVCLLSGGLDSAVVSAVAKSRGFAVYALSFDYGQRHAIELKAARKIAKHLNAKAHIILSVPLNKIGGSALTGKMEVPKKRQTRAMSHGIPVTYVPARNTIFLSLALACAEVAGARDIFFGANAIDYSGYPDCRPEYVCAFEKMANLATKAGAEGIKMKIHTPLISLTKAQIIKLGANLRVDFALTHSCYDPGGNGRPCGQCDSCQLREKGFKEAGIADPALKKGRRK